jgi:hypothetical protein
MKLPHILTFVILVAGSFWGVHENRNVTTLREKHQLVLRKAAALGIPADGSHPSAPAKITRRPREDAGLKVKGLIGRLVAQAREVKERQTAGMPLDEAAQKRSMEFWDEMLTLNGEELVLFIAGLKDCKDLADANKQGSISFCIDLLIGRNPQAALALLTESSGMPGEMSRNSISRALRQWAKDQPLEALKWLRENAGKRPELVNDEARRAVIAGAARNDIALALQLVGEFKLPVADGMVMYEIGQAATTPERQLEFLKALRQQAANTTGKQDDGKILTEGFRRLFYQVTQSGYDKSMDWLQSANLSATETGALMGSLNYDRTKTDAGKWLAWLSSQSTEGKKSEYAAFLIVRDWTENDYKAAGEWLAQAPAGPVKESAIRGYVETIAPYEPEVAAQWADTLPAEKQKSALSVIHRVLKQKDKAAADDFAARHGIEAGK